jgi:hypothetical protein
VGFGFFIIFVMHDLKRRPSPAGRALEPDHLKDARKLAASKYTAADGEPELEELNQVSKSQTGAADVHLSDTWRSQWGGSHASFDAPFQGAAITNL